MKKEVEFEAKSLVKKQTFIRLQQLFPTYTAISQENTYYDTETLTLKQHGAALRVRTKETDTVLTFKQPFQDGLLETHQPFTPDMSALLQSGEIPEGPVKIAITSLVGSPINVTPLGRIRTERRVISYENGLLCLDHSFYLQTEDYEVEFEGSSMTHAQEVLNNLLDKVGTQPIPTVSKIGRLFHSYQSRQ
ncbi:CYTH domain-containing protein [Shouchella lonarensis]|uniref:Uncharacterized protein YjbK n=1 Tax=Shouchella lonarensis TaxID=1464122 RepID=A0A1G6GLC6_9BACI|nr:CYTH domain-containing protein [Shouchella lonarensis]SDB82811.1 Uncharacterized protein YjbK [Shouchella lonarensis]